MMMPMWSMTEQPPDQKNDSGKNEHGPDKVTLLGIDLMLKLKTNKGDDSSKHEGGDDMSKRC